VSRPSSFFRDEEIGLHLFSKYYEFGDFKWKLGISTEEHEDEYCGCVYLLCEADATVE